MKKIIALFVITAASLGWKNTTAIADDWRMIAEKKVSFVNDRDMIQLGNQTDNYSKLKLRVTEGTLKMHGMKIYFDDGSLQDVSMERVIKEGEESPVVAVSGGPRRLTRIELHYQTKGFTHGRSTVTIWGM